MNPLTLLIPLGCVIGAILIGCAYWVYLDMREAAIRRQHEAEMADALAQSARQARAHRHDDRWTHHHEGMPD